MTCKECGHYAVCRYVEHQDIECNHFISKSALEKQTQKKLRVDDEGWLCCPKCDETFKLHNQYHEQNRYCGNCGQKIDWSEVNAKKGVIPNDRLQI